MSRDVPNPNAMGAYAAVGGALFLYAGANALAEGIKAAAWAHRENQILKQNAKNIEAVQVNANLLFEQSQTLLESMQHRHSTLLAETKETSSDLIEKHTLDIAFAVSTLTDNGYAFISEMRKIVGEMMESIDDIELSQTEEMKLVLEEIQD